jgi:hypothetical protein
MAVRVKIKSKKNRLVKKKERMSETIITFAIFVVIIEIFSSVR